MNDRDTADEPARASTEWTPADPDVRRLLDRLIAFEEAVTDTLDTLSSSDAAETDQAHTDDADTAADVLSADRWAERATEAAWNELVEWVDQLNASYSLASNYQIVSCWPAHPGAVEELAATHRAWKAAAITDAAEGDNGSNEMAAWHDGWLWPMLRRFDKGHYSFSGCHDTHRPERETARPTERAHIAQND